MSTPPRIVALGGGTGLPALLAGLRQRLFPQAWAYSPARGRDLLTAVVTTADDGGSSGRLRRAYGVLPPGDLRNCLIALAAGEEPTLASLFSYRFNGKGALAGHSLGNLILTALCELEAPLPRALERAGELLSVRGRVLPATAEPARLVAELADGSVLAGECRIGAQRRRGPAIQRVRFDPVPPALPEAVSAIERADLVVLAPGSLFTSLIPVLLVGGVVAAVNRSRARVAMAMNLMTEPSETVGLSAVDHLLAVRRHAPELKVHDVLLNDALLARADARRYAAEGASPVVIDRPALRALGCNVVERDLCAEGPKVRHDPAKLADAVLGVLDRLRTPAERIGTVAPAAPRGGNPLRVAQ